MNCCVAFINENNQTFEEKNIFTAIKYYFVVVF